VSVKPIVRLTSAHPPTFGHWSRKEDFKHQTSERGLATNEYPAPLQWVGSLGSELEMSMRSATSRRLSSRSFLPLAVLTLVAPMMFPSSVLAEDRCSGHELLSTPRSKTSCRNVGPELLVSPDKTLRALVFPVDTSLNATPDMESRVVIRSSGGATLASKDYSSPRGMNGYYVYRAQWSPDSEFFVFSMVSSGGHSPWSFPIMIYGRKGSRIVSFSDMIDGRPTVSGDFSFSGAHTLTASTWKEEGALEDKVAVTINLEKAFDKLTSSSR